jgi:hypothetical protein
MMICLAVLLVGCCCISSDLLGKFEGAGLGEYLCYKQARAAASMAKGEGQIGWGGHSIGWRGTLITGSVGLLAMDWRANDKKRRACGATLVNGSAR